MDDIRTYSFRIVQARCEGCGMALLISQNQERVRCPECMSQISRTSSTESTSSTRENFNQPRSVFNTSIAPSFSQYRFAMSPMWYSSLYNTRRSYISTALIFPRVIVPFSFQFPQMYTPQLGSRQYAILQRILSEYATLLENSNFSFGSIDDALGSIRDILTRANSETSESRPSRAQTRSQDESSEPQRRRSRSRRAPRRSRVVIPNEPRYNPTPKSVIEEIPRFEATSLELSQDEKCSVCQDKFSEGDSVNRLECSHHFHPECLKPWLKLQNTCPLCRSMVC